MKIAVVGKGGVGKTTLCGALARVFAAKGFRVLAVDADPDANLASVLPLDNGNAGKIIPLAARKELIRNRVNPGGNLPEGMFLLNPDVSDLPRELMVDWGGGQKLITMGWHKGGGKGCYCEENAILQQLLRAVLTTERDVVLIDSEAGLEHLSRGTVGSVDGVIVVIEPGRRSVETAYTVRKLAHDLGITNIYVVLNGYETCEEVEIIHRQLNDWQILAAFPRLTEIRRADLTGTVPDITGDFAEELEKVAQKLILDSGGIENG